MHDALLISFTTLHIVVHICLCDNSYHQSLYYRESPPITNKNCLFVIRNRAKINIFTIFSTITAPMQDIKIVIETSKIV